MKKIIFILLLCFIASDSFATNYYCKNGGDDSNTGLSDAQAWETISEVNSRTFTAGDYIYFHRGHFWREQLIVDSGDSSGYITYLAYGAGVKPLLYGSTEENDVGDWTDEGGNIWSNSDVTFDVDVGNIIFNNGTDFGIKVWEEADVNIDLEFWYDETNDLIKLYSTSNPASRFTDVECALRQDIFEGLSATDNHYVRIQDIELRYGGGHGIGVNGHDFVFRDVYISYIGGGDQYGGVGTTRYGNGIQVWADAYNVTVEKCKIWECYDEAITAQGFDCDIYNIYIRNNIFWNCHLGISIWSYTGDNHTVNNIYVENNTGLYAGYEWSYDQRPVKGSRHFCFGYIHTDYDVHNLYVRNNIFYVAKQYLIMSNREETVNNAVYDGNCYYQLNGTDGLSWISNPNPDKIHTFAEFADWQSDYSQDANSIAEDPLFDGGQYALQFASPCKNTGLTLTDVTHDYRNLKRPQGAGYDMGAMEFGGLIEFSGLSLNGVLYD